MSSDTLNFTMIDVNYVPGNKLQEESYRVVLSRGGVNGDTERGVVILQAEAFESFLGRAEATLRRNATVETPAY